MPFTSRLSTRIEKVMPKGHYLKSDQLTLRGDDIGIKGDPSIKEIGNVYHVYEKTNGIEKDFRVLSLEVLYKKGAVYKAAMKNFEGMIVRHTETDEPKEIIGLFLDTVENKRWPETAATVPTQLRHTKPSACTLVAGS